MTTSTGETSMGSVCLPARISMAISLAIMSGITNLSSLGSQALLVSKTMPPIRGNW